ncbi:type II secretion system protein GspL [Pseudophaeobacter flagellatus]|uniref:type II secretion system protein GspL n=1 Tax=Pseudophaeobacter flagellatus TaxID=2899119 RepID=UPI001E2CBB49|nr:type II secretion system protein GspL [Pseudophaeobacter flagellatus]MCD9149791.1 type II secretion system protein GspL [Pseudophaeobacter flagellatus]
MPAAQSAQLARPGSASGSALGPDLAQGAGQGAGQVDGQVGGQIIRQDQLSAAMVAQISPETVITVPGSQIPLLRLALPPGLRGQAREQVAKRQLADQTGLGQNSLSLRPFMPQQTDPIRSRQTRGLDSWTRVLAGDSDWLHSLQELPGRAVLPDYLTLPTAAGVWSLTLEQIVAPGPAVPPAAQPGPHPVLQSGAGSAATLPLLVARLGPGDGFSARPALGLAMLHQALQAAPSTPPQAILWLGPPEAPELAEITAVARAHDIALIHSPEEAKALDLPRPERFAHGELACDLRHNPMAARARLAAAVLPWRWPLLAACLAAGLWAAGQWIELTRISAEIAAQTARNQALVRAHFVPSGPVLDARLQVSRALADLQRNSAAAGAHFDPLDLTGRLAQKVAAAGLRPDLLSYRAGEGLLLALRLPDFAAADQLAATLRAAQLSPSLTKSRVDEARRGVYVEFVITDREPSPKAIQEPQP